MDARVGAAGVVVAGAVVALFVAVQAGDVTVENDRGAVTVAPGEQAVARAGEAPAKAAAEARVAEVEARYEALKREKDAQQADYDRLKARLAVLERENKAAAAEVKLRPSAEVTADLKALMKSEGLKLLALPKDHPLFRELVAMGPEGVRLLGELLKSGDADERFGAAAMMELLLDADAIPLLEDAIFGGDNDGNVLVQRMASHALGKIGGEAAVPVLERVVSEGSEWGVRTNAAYSLAEMGRQSGIDWLLDAYRTEQDAGAKMAILGAMGQVGDPSYLPTLHEVLKNETEYSKRYMAVMGIAKAARQESLSVLSEIIDDPNEDKMIITEAKKAYDEIRGEE